uniref:Uncharacterized protein n=1 Tax=Ciona intestinalis TaxID=7719 RepID=H2XJP8_CIOIN
RVLLAHSCQNHPHNAQTPVILPPPHYPFYSLLSFVLSQHFARQHD